MTIRKKQDMRALAKIHLAGQRSQLQSGAPISTGELWQLLSRVNRRLLVVLSGQDCDDVMRAFLLPMGRLRFDFDTVRQQLGLRRF